jgi:nitrous oxidase accessory protein NosD
MLKKYRSKFLSLIGIAFLASCTTQTLVQPPLQSQRKVLGVVNFDFSLVDNVLVSKARFSGTAGVSSQVAPVPGIYPDNAVSFERIFAGRTDYNRTQQRFLFSTFKMTNKSGGPLNNLTFYGIERGATSIGGTAFTSLRKEDGTSVADPVTRAREIKPNHGMRIDTPTLSLQVEQSRADFQAISSTESDAIQALIPPALVTAKGITDVLDYGFVVRNPNGVTNKRLLANDESGQLTVSFNFPLLPAAFDSVALWSWSFLVVDEPVTRVTRSLEELNTADVANRAQATGVVGAEVALMGRSLASIPTTATATDTPLTAYTGATLKQLPFNDVRIATFPTFISDFGVIWVQANASVGGNGSPGLPFRTIQEGIDAAEAGDVIRVRSGTYPDAVLVNKGVSIYGPASSTDGRDLSRCVNGTGPTCASDAKITGTIVIDTPAAEAVTLSGFRIEDNGFDAVNTRLAISVVTNENVTIENNVFYRDGANPVDVHPSGFALAAPSRAISTNPSATGSLVIRKNRITGNPSTGLFRGKSWDRGVWNDGGVYAANISDNNIDLVRTAINLEAPTAAHVITGNVFTDNGSGISVGTPSDLTLSLGGNEFSSSFPSTYLNLQNTPNGLVINVSPSTNKFDGVFPNVMTRSQLFALENRILHRVDKGCGGLARVIAANLYITPNSFQGGGCGATTTANIQRAIDVPGSGDTVQIEAGTYTNQLTIAENISFVGDGATTIIQAPAGTALVVNGGSSNNANLIDISTGTVSMDMLKIQGPHTRGAGTCNSNIKLNRGISVSGGASLTMTNSFVDSIRDTALFNCANQGVGIQVGASSSLNLSSSEITNFQSTGVFVTGAGSSAIIDDTLIQGNLSNPVTSRGIEVASSGVATITNNTIENVRCPSCGSNEDVGIGILLRTTGLVTITGNAIEDNELGINARGAGLNLAINNNTFTGNLDAGVRFFANDTFLATPASGNVTFDSNMMVGPVIPGTSVCFDAETNVAAGANLVITGTGNKISKCNFAIDINDTFTGDLNTINLSLQSGNIDGVTRDMVNSGAPAPDLVNNWWVTTVGPLPLNIPTLIGLANTAPLAVAPF